MPTLRSNRLFVTAAAAAAVLLAGLVAFSLLSGGDEAARADATAAEPSLFDGIPQDGLVLGDPGAPVTLVEYADVQCPYCAQWALETLPAIVDEYVRPGRVRLEFRGLAFLGPESELGLRSVLAAAEQDRGWNLLHAIFANQGPENGGWLTEETVREWVSSVPGLDGGRLEDDRSAAAVEKGIAAAAEQARLAGVPGTPSFEVGVTGGELELVQLTSLGPDGLRPFLDRLLAP